MISDYIEAGLDWGWTSDRVAKAIRNRSTNVAVARGHGGVLDLESWCIAKRRRT